MYERLGHGGRRPSPFACACSWNIACHLGGEAGRGLARLANHWSVKALGPAIRRLIAADFIQCLAEEDRAYYRSSREAAFGMTLEEYCADRPRRLAEFADTVAPLEKTLAEQPYLAGAAPSYADYLVSSVFQYAKLGAPEDFVAEGTALRRWRDGLADSFDGLGNRYPRYPV